MTLAVCKKPCTYYRLFISKHECPVRLQTEIQSKISWDIRRESNLVLQIYSLILSLCCAGAALQLLWRLQWFQTNPGPVPGALVPVEELLRRAQGWERSHFHFSCRSLSVSSSSMEIPHQQYGFLLDSLPCALGEVMSVNSWAVILL